MAKTIIKGDDLMLFYNGKALAYATAHTLSITGDSTDTSSKDHGMFKGNKVNKISWELTSENLYTEDNFSMLFDAMVKGDAITVKFGSCTANHSSITDAVIDNTTHAVGTNYFTGEVYITSLSANANTGENATYSVTLTGNGKLSYTGTVGTNTTASV